MCVVAALGLAWTVADPGRGLWMGGSWGDLPIGLARVAYSFTAGVLLYELVLRHGRARATWLAMVPVVLTTALMLVAIDPARRGVFDLGVILVALPQLVWLAARWNPPARLTGLFGWLGETSYPLYTTHYALIFLGAFVARKLGLSVWLWVPALVGGLLLFATILSRWVDEPARRTLSRRWRSR